MCTRVEGSTNCRLADANSYSDMGHEAQYHFMDICSNRCEANLETKRCERV